ESATAGAALTAWLDPQRPPHVGALLDNVPEMAFLLGAAGLGGMTLVGLNTTRRGEALAGDIARSDCQVVVTEPTHLPLLAGLDLPGVTVLDTSSRAWTDLLAAHRGATAPAASAEPDDLMMLIFTSGTSGDP